MRMLGWTGMVGLLAVGGMCLAVKPVQGDKKVDNRVFEMRTYYAAPGKMADLQARFRDHTCKIFEKHGMTVIGFWSPSDPQEAEKKLFYILAFPSKAAKEKAWKEFQADPDWKAAKAQSEKNGTLVTKVEPVLMNPTDFSPIH